MSEEINLQMDGLIEKYCELLLGNTETTTINKVKMWMMYNHISKSMPALAKHWNDTYPEGKKEIITIIQEIKKLNEEHRANK